MGEILDRRRQETAARVKMLREALGDAEKLCGERACVYATGSFGRGEAGSHSDLDLFIVGGGTPENPALGGLDEILIKADLIEATRKFRIPDFSGEGEYLYFWKVSHFSASRLITRLLVMSSRPTGRITKTTKMTLCLPSWRTTSCGCGERFA